MFYPARQSARHLPRNPSVDWSSAQRAAHCQARPPISDCSSTVHRPRLRSGCGLERRPERRRRVCENAVQSGLAAGYRPTKSPLGRSPLGSFQDTTSGSGDEAVELVTDHGTDAIYCLGDLVGRVARDLLRESGAEDFTSRTSLTPGESLDFLEHLVRYRHGCFHTNSITAEMASGCDGSPRGTRPCAAAAPLL